MQSVNVNTMEEAEAKSAFFLFYHPKPNWTTLQDKMLFCKRCWKLLYKQGVVWMPKPMVDPNLHEYMQSCCNDCFKLMNTVEQSEYYGQTIGEIKNDKSAYNVMIITLKEIIERLEHQKAWHDVNVD